MVAPELDDGPMGHIPDREGAGAPGLEEEKGLKAGSAATDSADVII